MANVVVDLTQEEEEPEGKHHLRMWIPMPPIAKPSVSYGPGRGGPKGWFRMYINSGVKKKMAEFRLLVKEAAARERFHLIPRNKPVQMTVWFFLRRPDDDFTSRHRGKGRLKESAKASTVAAVKPDTDNLGKFLLDALTGALYEDDAQVVELHMFKLRDSTGTCEGCVAIDVNIWNEDVNHIMPQF